MSLRISPRRMRSAVTLGVLSVLIVVGAIWAWSALWRPFPGAELGGGGAEAEEICTTREVASGSRLTPDGVTVSVMNAGSRSGAARSTLQDLVEAGFAEGTQGNAPEDAEVTRVQIWADDPRNPAVRLVASWLGDDIRVEQREVDTPGVVVVVGNDFDELADGRPGIPVREDTTVCGPATA